MSQTKNHYRFRLATSLLLTLILGGILLAGQKLIYTDKMKIFYFQGKPGTLFFALFACTIAVYFYLFTKRGDTGKVMKKWCLTINTILFVLLLPLQVFSMDSYFYISDREVVESKFWNVGDKETVDWKDLKKSVLTVFGDGNSDTVSIINRLVFRNGKTYDINISTIGKQEFSKLLTYLKHQKLLVEVQRPSEEQLQLVRSNYGPQVAKLFIDNKNG
ncbi:hypothetical protein MK805_12025 [Shimazuella sp. AN120528]|uniref:hypothetical protein n=1 Tax=Shimazuella soli TaxID=1892854 RepID=UPI001F1138E1|nr:hypothetical protein [Shimazuella soli]MCH5585672.1 hypothetical protein [Shimazuella soli]